MLMQSDKLSNKSRGVVNEVTKNLTTVFSKIQEQDERLKKDLEAVKIEFANEIQAGDKNCYLIQVNESSIKNLHNVHSEVVQKLESHFSTPVVIVPYRQRINGKTYRRYKGAQVPRNKTLTATYDALLEDLLYPATIVGKRIRYPKGKGRQYKVLVDKLDKNNIGYKTSAITAAYKALTNRDLTVEFPEHS